MFYEKGWYNSTTLKWDDFFESANDFITKMTGQEPKGVGGITDTTNLTELYYILSFKYVNSHTRYTDLFAFTQAIKRELHTEFPFYLEKKALVDEMIALTDADIEFQQGQLRNLVDQHDEPVADADTIAIDDLSTQQENVRMVIGKLQAKKDKYNVMNRDYLRGIYKRCDELFRVILAKDIINLYEE